MSHNKAITFATLLTASSLLLVGCSTGSVSGPSSSASDSASPTATIEYETAPLTGEQYITGSDAFLAGPAIMGKVDNSPDARPQNSLNQTDLVFEEMVEGGMTRFLAIWHSQLPETFGPVRSVRPMDPDLASPFGGIISFSGGQLPFVKAMQATDVYVTDETSQQGKNTFERVSNRFAPHNVMVHAQKLAEQHSSIAPPKTQFNFAAATTGASASLSGKSVDSFSVSFPAGKPTWTWNAAAGLWLRSQYGAKETDANDGKQLHAANVIVLKTKIDRSFKDFKYGYVPRTIVIGGGSGYVFSGGKTIAVSFKKANQNDPIHLFDSAGNPVLLSAGNTWIELMPSDVGAINIKYTKIKVLPGTSTTATPSATK